MFQEKTISRPRIKGTTTIDHRFCYESELTFTEYVLLDYIAEHPGVIDQNDLFGKKGLNIALSKAIIESLVQREWLILNEGGYAVSDRWKKQFSLATDFDSEDPNDPGFWQIFKKNGNKKMAEKAYAKARKVVDKKTLHEAAKRYMKSKEGNDIWMHASTYLNPENRQWENVIVIKGEKHEQEKLSFKIPTRKGR